MQVLVAGLVVGVIHILVLSFLRRRYDSELFRITALAYMGTIALRYALAVYLWLGHADPGFSQMFWGDSRTYDSMGAAVAESWAYGEHSTLWTETVSGKVNKGFIYVVAVVYYLFGHNVLLMQFINGIIGALTPIVIMEIGLVVYHRKVAVPAMLLTAFFPQMIFWSAALYKDPAVMLCISLNILAVFRLRLRKGFWWIPVYVGTAVALVWLRFYIFYAVVAAGLTGVLVTNRRGSLYALVTQLGVVSSAILIFVFTPVGQEVLAQSRFLDLEMLQVSRVDLARADSGFAADADVSTLTGALSVLPVGIAQLLFAPFPWTVSNLRQMLALPDVLLWYALIPSLAIGLWLATKRLRQTMPILVFTTALTLAYGMFLGNVGTAYRQRTQIMMFYFLFVADGIHYRHQRSRGVASSVEVTPDIARVEELRS